MQPQWFAGDDFQIERSESLSIGMSDQLWPVYDHYDIDGLAIKPRGNSKVYFPMSKPSLPCELAKILPNDSEAASSFVHEWGLLGEGLIIGNQSQRGEDTLAFVWGHAMTIRNVLTLIDALENGTPTFLDRKLDSIVRHLPVKAGSKELKQCWPRMEGAGAIVSAELIPLSPEDLALKIIAQSISKNLEGMRPVVATQPPDDEPTFDTMLPRLRFTFCFQAMVQCAYWHLAMLTTKKGAVVQCRECGGFFERTDKRQQFCPPTEEEINNTRRRQSRCGLRNRQRRG